jgi:hypothetical protein
MFHPYSSVFGITFFSFFFPAHPVVLRVSAALQGAYGVWLFKGKFWTHVWLFRRA